MALVGLAVAVSGCSWAPVQPAEAPARDSSWASWGTGQAADGQAGRGGQLGQAASQRPAAQAVGLASGLIGSPYRWGGATPAGFDCSGLVYYTYRKAGLEVPRTSQQQFHAAQPVPIGSAEPGDLVFFGQRGRISHVGIYIGDEQFIHAPESGRTVTVASLSDGYYRARFAGAGRFD
jgi:cell wall-associated NlpC family hydrolase